MWESIPFIRLLYEGSKTIKNSLSCICMSHVAVCAHIVMKAENACGEEIRNVWCGHNTICNLVQYAKAGVGTSEFQ